MFRTPNQLGTVAILLLAVMLAACSTAVGNDPSPSLPASPGESDPGEPTPSPMPSEAPSEAPSHTPTPATPDPTAAPTEQPIEVVRLEMPVIARVTADAVAVSVLPGLDQPLIQASGPDGKTIAALRLSEGASVSVAWGPVFVDGHSWYAIQPGVDDVTWGEGWIAADFLVEEVAVGLYPLIRADGLGAGGAVSTHVTERSAVNATAIVTPMPGAESCEAELVVIGTDGEATTVGSQTVTETLRFFGSPLENSDLYQETAGEITLQMLTDCSWAAIAFVPQG